MKWVVAALVLVGIGGIANDDLARTAGLKCTNGVVVDEHSRTGHPDIYAAGVDPVGDGLDRHALIVHLHC